MFIRGTVGLVAVVCWLTIFLLGLTIDSRPYRNALGSGNVTFEDLAIALLTYTVTNAAILCVLSGIVGAMSYALLFQRENDDDKAEGLRRQSESTVVALVAGILRSFVIFLVFISGIYIGASDAFGQTSPQQYARVVATICLLSFLVSFNPKHFSKVLDWFTGSEEIKG